MRYEAWFQTAAAPERVWAELVDVEAWPRWMSSYTLIRRLDSGPLRAGSAAAVKQPGLSPVEYLVTAIAPGREFTWVSRVPGARTEARHAVRPGSSGGSTIELTVEQTGALAGVVGLALGRKIRRYLQVEGRGLCAASEV